MGRGEVWQVLSLALASPFSRQRLGHGLLHVLAGDSSALRVYYSLCLPFSLYLSFITLLPLLVHIEQNENILQNPSAYACCLPVQMAPCDGSLLFHQKTSQGEFVLHY